MNEVDVEEKEDEEVDEDIEKVMWDALGKNEKESSEEAAVVKAVKKEHEPTEKEVEEHMITHLPYRSWCTHCVKGKAKGHPHRRTKEEGKIDEVPVVSMDYMFMGDQQSREEETGMPILVMKDRKSKTIRARVVPAKGRQEYAIKRCSLDLKGLGHRKIILKSDGEPAIKALKDAVKGEGGIDIVPEESPGYDSKGNGEIEKAIQMVQDQFRSMKDALEARYQRKLRGDHVIVPWLIAHSADMLTRFHVYQDGRTAYRNLKGREFKK